MSQTSATSPPECNDSIILLPCGSRNSEEPTSMIRMTAAEELREDSVAFVLQFAMDADRRRVVPVNCHQFQTRKEPLQLRLRLGLTGGHCRENPVLLGGAALQ